MVQDRLGLSDVHLPRWRLVSVAGGVIAWLLTLGVYPSRPTIPAGIEPLLAFAMLVIAPLGLGLAAAPDRNGRHSPLYRAAVILQPFAAVFAVVSLTMPTGIQAAALGMGWLLFTGLAALFGLVRLLRQGLSRTEEGCISAGLLYLPVGGVWFILSRLGLQPLGFGDAIVLLTAVHFHYVSLAALVIAGMIGRRLAGVRPAVWGLYRPAAIGLIVSPALAAAGITLSALAQSFVLEAIAALLLAASVVTLALLSLRFVVPAAHSILAQALLLASSGAVLVTMVFAVGYALGRLTGAWEITIPQMVQVHGWLNALGFGLCGLLGWSIAVPGGDREIP